MSKLALVKREDIENLYVGSLPGYNCSGEWTVLEVTCIPESDNIPLSICQALLGLKIETWFTKTDIVVMCGPKLGEIVPNDTRLTYVPTLACALRQAGKQQEATLLKELAPVFSDMIAIPESCLRFLKGKKERKV